MTGLVVGTTVFFEAGVVILIPLAFGLARKTKKSTLLYVIPLLAGLATGFAFIPPSAGSVLAIVLIPLVLILCSTVSEYMPVPAPARPVLEFLGTPFVALIIAVLAAMLFLGERQGYSGDQLKQILDRSLKPTGQILLVITGGGIIRWVLQDCGMGEIIGPALEESGLPLILVAFLIAALIRASVGAAVVAMTMAAGIMASRAFPAVPGSNGVCHQRRRYRLQPCKRLGLLAGQLSA